MTLQHLKHGKKKAQGGGRKAAHWPGRQAIDNPQKNLTTGLSPRKVEYLARIHRDAIKQYKHHQERELLMNDIKRKQRLSTYEGERDRFEAARIKGPLNREHNARLGQLKTLLGK